MLGSGVSSEILQKRVKVLRFSDFFRCEIGCSIQSWPVSPLHRSELLFMQRCQATCTRECAGSHAQKPSEDNVDSPNLRIEDAYEAVG